MTGIVIVLVVVGALVGLGFSFGGPALVVLLVLAALIGFGWLLVMGLSRRTRSDVDDPNR